MWPVRDVLNYPTLTRLDFTWSDSSHVLVALITASKIINLLFQHITNLHLSLTNLLSV